METKTIVGSQQDLPEEACWEVSLNGEPVPHSEVQHLTIQNERMGLAVHYGRVGDAPYAQAVFEKPGGVTILPICPHPVHGILVGVVSQPRPLQTDEGPVCNAPRGFRLPDEALDQAASRELLEELGGLTKRIRRVSGCGVHMDNALVTYTEGSCGDYFFYVEVAPGELREVDPVWKFVDGLVDKPTQNDEKILGCVFIPLDEVMNTVEDAYTRLALLGALKDLNRIIG